MADLQAQVRELIASDRLREAALSLRRAGGSSSGAWRDELAAWQGALELAERQHRTDELSASEYALARKRLALRLLALSGVVAELLAELQPPPSAPSATGAVFLSYNHADSEIAMEVRSHLDKAGITVRMDADAMPPGAPIRGFIRDSIAATSVTVCVVSERSLLSGWVAQETALALTVLELWQTRRFVACYLDTAFLDVGFGLRAAHIIEQRLSEIEALYPKYAQVDQDTQDLNAEKSRLYDLKHHLGAVLAHLRDSLCLDIRKEARAASLARLVATLRGGR